MLSLSLKSSCNLKCVDCMFAKSKAAEWAFDLILKKLLLVGPVLTVLIILSLKRVSKADVNIKARCEQQ